MANQDFRDRAQAFWDAQIANDSKVLYQYLPLEDRNRIGSEDFVKASMKKSPLHYLNFRLGESETVGELGWVHVVYDAALAEFPEYPPRHIDLWQTWERQEDEWLPASARRKNDLPKLPPRMRPAEEEQLLAKRVDEFWAAKESEEWVVNIKLLRSSVQELGFIERVPREKRAVPSFPFDTHGRK